MPFSSDNGKSYIKSIVSKISHARMLDIGCGGGTYAKLFPDAEWTGVEIWEPYVSKYGLDVLYHNLIVADARTWRPKERYDVAICGDVLEHMTPQEAHDLVYKLWNTCDAVIASIPIGHWPQGEAEGNPHERHVKDDWTHEDVCKLIAEPVWSRQDGEIGVYVWSRKYNEKVFADRKLKIAVYAISKNEEQFVERFCDSAKHADLIFIADTGSTDATVEKAQACGATVGQIHISPWRFDLARNAALAMIPADIDVCVSLDLDEVMEPGWREEIERVWTPQTTRLGYMFDWGCGIKFRYEKIHARHGYRWHHPVHEYPVPDGRIAERFAETPALLVSHHPDSTKSRSQYMPLLELAVKEDPRCPRNRFYHARELTFHARWDEAIVSLKSYLEMPEATWPNERCYAMRLLGKASAELGRWDEAEAWYQKAGAEAPNTREPWCELAMLYYRREKWAQCYAASVRALEIADRDFVYTCDPEVWGHWPHDLASISAWRLGMIEASVEQARLASEKSPNDQRLSENLRFLSEYGAEHKKLVA